jgi:hypothetical protein
MTTIAERETVDRLKAAATDEDALLLLALSDAASSLAEFCVVGRSRGDALKLLDNWANVFARHTAERRKRR